mmetsp:Transcript_86455/g.201139  ORF Transcript_86455/g.201139 Transcript_86455/m.201139 type:complete len:119 (-) Transcript_86455:252-608(-)
MGTCASSRDGAKDQQQRQQELEGDSAHALGSLHLSKGDRDKLQQFESKMKSTLLELNRSSEHARLLQEENSSLKLNLQELVAKNVSLKQEISSSRSHGQTQATVATAGEGTSAEEEVR